MICPKCGQKNDEDASFCEKCGTKFNTTSLNNTDTKKPLKKETIAQSTKILIIVCVVLVIGVAGIIIKNSQHNQNPTSNNASMNQITNESGFLRITGTQSSCSNSKIQWKLCKC